MYAKQVLKLYLKSAEVEQSCPRKRVYQQVKIASFRILAERC